MTISANSYSCGGMLLVFIWTACFTLTHNIAMAQLPEVCSLPSDTGPCRAAFRRFYFDTRTQQCQGFIYGGCQGNDNNFNTLTQCQSACVCKLPRDSGTWRQSTRNTISCRWQMPRYYDAQTSTCKMFFYWGCGGNGNRFRSDRECYKACGASRCFASRETRQCRGQGKGQRRFYFDAGSNQCLPFSYKGCNYKTENQFSSRKECQRVCM